VDKYWEESRKLWVECGLDPEELSIVVYPVYPYSGQPCYVEIDAWMDYVADPSLIDKLKVFMEKETDKITDVGIYALFRPYRDVIKQTMPKLKGNYISLWRKIKDLIDPNNIMNPGALFEE
jgi:FAD linked oxidases, C-terminal domain.